VSCDFIAGATRSSLSFAWEPPKHDHGAPVGCYQVDYAQAGRGRSSSNAAWKLAYKGDALSYDVSRASIHIQEQIPF